MNRASIFHCARLAVLLTLVFTIPLRAEDKNTALKQRMARALQSAVPQLKQIKQPAKRRNTAKILSIALTNLGLEKDALTLIGLEPRLSQIEAASWRDSIKHLEAERRASSGDPHGAQAILEKTRSIRCEDWFLLANAYSRIGDKPAMRTALKRAASLALSPAPAERSYDDIAYTAALMARDGDLATARQLFLEAHKVEDESDPDAASANPNLDAATATAIANGVPDERRQTLSYYEGKAGFWDEALATAGHNEWALTGVLAQLYEKRQFERASRAIPSLSPARQAAEWGDLAVWQTLAGEKAQSHESRKKLRQLIETNLSKQDRAGAPGPFGHSFREYWSLQLAVLAYCQMMAGERAHCLATLVKARRTAGFAPADEALLWLNLVAPRFLPEMPGITPTLRRDFLARATVSIRHIPLSGWRLFRGRAILLHRLAEAQFELNGLSAGLATLREAAQAACVELGKAQEEFDGTLVSIASEQRIRGDKTGSMQSLRWFMEIGERRHMAEYAASCLPLNGLVVEGLRFQSKTPRADEKYSDFGSQYAAIYGVDAALRWAQSLRVPMQRILALAAIAQSIKPERPGDGMSVGNNPFESRMLHSFLG